MGEQSNIILITGPTASGKSQLAMDIAMRHDSVIINTDSMQVYADLQILTARPQKSEMQHLPHALYGFVDGAQAFSVGHWLTQVRSLLENQEIQPKKLIFVGGTGLYFRALAGGLSRMPKISQSTRNFWREKLAREGAAHLHTQLWHRDPIVAQRLQPSDGQRIIRALEILEETGKSLEFWQSQKSPPLINMKAATKILILPARDRLYARINQRLDQMLAYPLLDEVATLLNRKLDEQLPIMKAIGVQEFGAFLRGEIDEEQALMLTKQETRRYAKRQMSWFRNQLEKDEKLEEKWQIFPNIEEISHNF